MWACMGYIVPEYFRWPGYCSPSSGMHCAHYGANMLHATLDGEDPVPIETGLSVGLYMCISFL